MTAVKICGVTDRRTMEQLAALGADYVGFVFAPSRRQLDPRTAAAIVQGIPRLPRLVGVFVNPGMVQLAEVLEQVPLDTVQLHGQEPPDLCREVRDRWGVAVWKAIPVRADGWTTVHLEAYTDCVDAFLFDTHHPTQAGGTGRTFSWNRLPALFQRTGSVPQGVAGGIREDNVAELIVRFRPWLVDVSSGVETNGTKDAAKISRLMERVRACDENGFFHR